MQKRSVLLLVAILFAMSGILAKLVKIGRDPIESVSLSQSTVTVTVAEQRGTIYDRHLKPLTNAETQYAASITADPETMATLSNRLSKEEWEIIQNGLQSGKPVTVVSDSPFPLVKGVRQFTVPIRYSDNQVAAHLIGYLNSDGVTGACGLEAAFDDLLRESSGSVTVSYQTDGRGNTLTGGKTQVSNTLKRAEGGICLTIEKDVQEMVEKIAGEKISKGAVVVMEAQSGNVTALASFPSFNSNRLADYLEREDAPLFNRALATYNCGSVFKTVSALAALESGYSASKTYTCLGALKVGGNRIKCHHVLGHGELDMTKGFALSCNPYFMQLIAETGASPLYRLACALGFDSPILLTDRYATSRATIPDEQTLLQETVLANVSFGQGNLMATPIHVAQMTACVVNGGYYYRPNVLYGIVNENGALTRNEKEAPISVCSAASAETVKNMMIAVVEEGSGKSAKPRIGGAGGKTGTAETGWRGEDGEMMVQN